MKRICTLRKQALLLLMLAVSGTLEAQKLPDSPHKEWYYGFASHEIWSSNYFFQHLVTAGDTVIMDKECIVIKQADDYGNGFNASAFDYANMGKTSFFLCRESDKLLWYNEDLGEFTTLHDYSAQVGGGWTIQVGTCSFDVIVDSTDLLFFGGKNHRVLYVHNSEHETSHYPYYEGCIIEDIGHTKHFFPIEIYWLCHGSFLCGVPETTGIRCVIENGELLYHQGEIACDSVYSILHIGIGENVELQDVNIYPNPVTDYLKIQHDNLLMNEYTYWIYDCKGTCCASGTTQQSDCISVEKLSKGFYLLKLSSPLLSTDYFMKFVRY